MNEQNFNASNLKNLNKHGIQEGFLDNANAAPPLVMTSEDKQLFNSYDALFIYFFTTPSPKIRY